MSEWIAGFLVLAGGAFSLVSAIGVVRFPDLYTRMHAATKAGTLGVGLVVAASAIAAAEPAATLTALATIAFVFITAPIASYAIANTAYRTGQARPRVIVDQLRQAAQEREQ